MCVRTFGRLVLRLRPFHPMSFRIARGCVRSECRFHYDRAERPRPVEGGKVAFSIKGTKGELFGRLRRPLPLPVSLTPSSYQLWHT